MKEPEETTTPRTTESSRPHDQLQQEIDGVIEVVEGKKS